MKVLRIDMYRDGGTWAITTDNGEFTIDHRIAVKNTAEEGKIYKNHPGKADRVNLTADPLLLQLFEALVVHSHELTLNILSMKRNIIRLTAD